jgi:hypothetical protein
MTFIAPRQASQWAGDENDKLHCRQSGHVCAVTAISLAGFIAIRIKRRHAGDRHKSKHLIRSFIIG